MTCHFKIDTRNFTNFDPSTQKWPKYILLELHNYRRVIFYDTEELCKFWRKTDLWFEKWHEKFGKFSPEHLKVSKLGFWWDCFVQSRKVMTLNLQRSYVLWQWRYDTKFEEELICHFKTDMRNLVNFDSSTPKSKKKKCSLISSFDQSI